MTDTQKVQGFDFRNPDYRPVMEHRLRVLKKLRANPTLWTALRTHYREFPYKLINDWGMTRDPRGVGVVPFLLFPRQIEWCEFILRKWRSSEDGLTEKSRDMGVSWLAVSLSAALCILYPNITVGFGSKTEDDVDKSGDPDSLFFKARSFVENLPPELRSGYSGKTTSHMLIGFPETGSNLKGDAGDNIGRGGRASIYFIDEASHLARPKLVDAALSQNTPCRQDVSTPRGLANSFAVKRHEGKIEVFTFHWREDPRKDQAWYEKQQQRLNSLVLAQEVDLDYTASAEGVLIPSAWIQASIDAHVKLNFEPTGERAAALDVADEGVDLNAFCGAHGFLVEHLEVWSGKGSDMMKTTQKAFDIADSYEYGEFKYDADGLGAGIKGFARVINEQRAAKREPLISVRPFRGSAAVFDPERQDIAGRKNKDVFLNLKAQAWWRLRTRFERTYQAVVGKEEVHPDEIISIPSTLPDRLQLVMELSQPTYTINGVGKFVIDKTPEGASSPNRADALMIRFSRSSRAPMVLSGEARSRFAPVAANTRTAPQIVAAAPVKRPAGVLGALRGKGISPSALARFR